MLLLLPRVCVFCSSCPAGVQLAGVLSVSLFVPLAVPRVPLVCSASACCPCVRVPSSTIAAGACLVQVVCMSQEALRGRKCICMRGISGTVLMSLWQGLCGVPPVTGWNWVLSAVGARTWTLWPAAALLQRLPLLLHMSTELSCAAVCLSVAEGLPLSHTNATGKMR
jgi:hypothetical protein